MGSQTHPVEVYPHFLGRKQLTVLLLPPGLMVNVLGLWVRSSECETRSGHCVVFLGKTLSSHSASIQAKGSGDTPCCYKLRNMK